MRRLFLLVSAMAACCLADAGIEERLSKLEKDVAKNNAIIDGLTAKLDAIVDKISGIGAKLERADKQRDETIKEVAAAAREMRDFVRGQATPHTESNEGEAVVKESETVDEADREEPNPILHEEGDSVSKINWNTVNKLVSQLQQNVAKKFPVMVLSICDSIIAQIKQTKSAYLAYDTTHHTVTAGVTQHIAGKPTISVNIMKLIRRGAEGKLLNFAIEGMGVIYTGENDSIEAYDPTSYDPRMRNGEGGEIYATGGKIKTTRAIAGSTRAKDNFYKIMKAGEKAAQSGFVHMSFDEVDMDRHSHDRELHLVLADKDKEGLVVRAVMSRRAGVWEVTHGRPRDCVKCMTPELRSFFKTQERK